MLPPIELFLFAIAAPSLMVCIILGVPHLTGQAPLTPATRRLCMLSAFALVLSIQTWALHSLSLGRGEFITLSVAIPFISFLAVLVLANILDSIDPRIVRRVRALMVEPKGGSHTNLFGTHQAPPSASTTEEKTVA